MVRVTLVLARGPRHPEGNLDDRMHLQVSLTPQGHLDGSAWETDTLPWPTSRELAGHAVRTGELVKIEKGGALRELASADEPLYSLEAAIVRPGELVRVGRLDGDEMLYRIVAVDPD